MISLNHIIQAYFLSRNKTVIRLVVLRQSRHKAIENVSSLSMYIPADDRISDWIIAVSYFAIPFELVLFAYKYGVKQKAPTIVLSLFVAFITLCGVTHVCNALDANQSNHLFKLLTAAVSLVTSLALIKVIPLVMQMPGKINNLDTEITYESNMRIFNQTLVMCTRNLREPHLVELAAQTLKYMFPACRIAIAERGVQLHHGLCETIINDKYSILTEPDLYLSNKRFFIDLAEQISQQQTDADVFV